MTWLYMNIPLMIIFFGLWTGIPLWMVLKRKDTAPKSAVAPAVRSFPAKPDTSYEADYRRQGAA